MVTPIIPAQRASFALTHPKAPIFDRWIQAKAAVGGVYGTFNVTNSDPSAFPSFILGSNNVATGGYDWANYDPSVIDTLINEGTTTLDPAKRLAIYGQMLKIIATDLPWVPIYIEDYNFALSSKYTWPNYNVYTQWGSWGAQHQGQELIRRYGHPFFAGDRMARENREVAAQRLRRGYGTPYGESARRPHFADGLCPQT